MPSFIGKDLILIDDGIATGATMIATIHALRASGIKKLIIALPVAPPGIVKELDKLADELVIIYTPSPFLAVGEHYQDFRQVSDDEVKKYLEEAKTIDQFHKEVRL